ncbi:MAG: flagellar filament capping protein FliD [Deltaproteobacteria bacterium]|nr:flagellar filament capping protein FliD [Deltaproteobacteria bacterium]
MAINFTGLGSGIDSAQIIDQLLYLERAPIRQMEQRQSDYRSQRSIIQNVNSKLQSLQTKAQDMDTIGEFLSYSASSSDEDEVTATASGTASPGTYDVTVTELAKAQRTYSDPIVDGDTAGSAGVGTLTITIDSVTIDIDVTAEDTMSSIVSKINSSEAEVSASLLIADDGYRIQVTGNDTGVANEVTFAEDGSLALDLEDPLNVVEAAQDAELTVDGFDITSADNDVDDAITGLTLTLHEKTTSTIEIAVSPDTDAIKTKLDEFIDTYNEVASLIQSEFAFTGEAKGNNRLAGDSTLRTLQTQLSTTITSAIEGLEGTYEALSQIGISTDTNGSLSVDTEELEAAIAADTVGVGQLFSGTADHSVGGIADKMDDLAESFVDYADGILTAKVNGLDTTIDSMTDTIDRYEDRISMKETQLRMQFTNLEVMMSQLTSQGNFMASQSFLW